MDLAVKSNNLDPGGFGEYEPQFPPRDHNQPPLTALLDEDTEEIRQVRDGLLASFGKAPESANDQITAKAMTDLAGQLAECLSRTEKAFHKHKDPITEQGRAIDRYFNQIRASLNEPIAALKTRLLDWRNRERDRVRREQEAEAARLAAEAERLRAQARTQEQIDEVIETRNRAEEAGAPVFAAPIRGGLGTAAFTQKRWKHRITNPLLIPLDKLLPHMDLDDLVGKFVRTGGRDLPGVEIYEDEEIRVRRS